MEKNKALIQELVSYLEKNLISLPENGEEQAPDALSAEYIKGDYTGRDARNLQDLIRDLGETFHEMLFRKINEEGLPDVEVYKKANLDRKLFSKIRSNPAYHPRKNTVLALAVALKLDLDETVELLTKAGYALSPGSKGDLIVRYFIERAVYDIDVINYALYEFGQPTLGG